MASRPEKVSVDLDAEIVERTRLAVGSETDTDSVIVERALNAYLLGRILDITQAQSNLSEEEAERLAYEELHAMRRERGAA
jgi:hypothetical protein